MNELAKDIKQDGEVKLPDNCVAEPNAGIGELKTDHERLQWLLKLATANEDKYYDLAGKAMEKNNMIANMVHCAEASAFQRMRYAIEHELGLDQGVVYE